MCSRRKVNFLGVWVLLTLTITCIQAFPGDRQARQEDEDEGERSTISPINFGAQVAQIITGAFTGNIDSIIKGSFGFIEDPNVNKLSHNTWETLKGNPTQTPPWAGSTAAPARPAQVAAAPAPPQPEQQPQPVAVSSLSAAPQLQPEVVESAPASSGLSALPVAPPEYSYNPGTSSYRTRRPARTTQPTYATLAPLSAVEGDGQTETEPEPEEPSTTVGPDDEDVDEAESLSGEVSGGTSAPTEAIPVTQASITTNREVTTVVIEGAEATTDEDDEQEQENFIYST